jgi:hypothetical protein
LSEAPCSLVAAFINTPWTSRDEKMHNRIGHILIGRRRHSSILDVRTFRGADCDSDHYLVVAKVSERLSVSKRMVKKMDMERFNLKQLNEGEVSCYNQWKTHHPPYMYRPFSQIH